MVPFGNPAAPTAACTLTYYGGPIVSNLQVVPVFWNSSVNATIVADIPQFYSDLTVSAWYDFLSQYASVGGTGQSIGRGTSATGVTITPSHCAGATSCSLTDDQLQSEIKSQITNSVLPAPEFDGGGNPNTVYMVHFPVNVTLTGPGGSGTSCVDFCSYHGTSTFGAGNKPLLYGAIMDVMSGPCALGCGANASAFNNETSSASHQIAEVATDADVGLAISVGAPLAWYNNSCGEIADICNAQQDTITVSGRTWTVQKQWSNAASACVTTGTPPDFAVSGPSTTPAGTAFSFGVTARNPYTHATDTAFVGTVHFTSSDPGAILPTDFTFVPADLGVATLDATLTTLGGQTITATDTLNGSIVGTSASINVTTAQDGTTLSTACPTTFVENQSITLTATVTNGANPTGSMTFADGPTVFCSDVALVSGAAGCQTAALTVQGGGTSYIYNPVASYSGDGSNAPSASSALPLTVLAVSDVVFRGAFEAAVAGCPTD